jgi:hypothetical protein
MDKGKGHVTDPFDETPASSSFVDWIPMNVREVIEQNRDAFDSANRLKSRTSLIQVSILARTKDIFGETIPVSFRSFATSAFFGTVGSVNRLTKKSNNYYRLPEITLVSPNTAPWREWQDWLRRQRKNRFLLIPDSLVAFATFPGRNNETKREAFLSRCMNSKVVDTRFDTSWVYMPRLGLGSGRSVKVGIGKKLSLDGLAFRGSFSTMGLRDIKLTVVCAYAPKREETAARIADEEFATDYHDELRRREFVSVTVEGEERLSLDQVAVIAPRAGFCEVYVSEQQFTPDDTFIAACRTAVVGEPKHASPELASNLPPAIATYARYLRAASFVARGTHGQVLSLVKSGPLDVPFDVDILWGQRLTAARTRLRLSVISGPTGKRVTKPFDEWDEFDWTDFRDFAVTYVFGFLIDYSLLPGDVDVWGDLYPDREERERKGKRLVMFLSDFHAVISYCIKLVIHNWELT